jgi:LysR family transcriptional regulator, low CO2-responsive transcriptional regulator
MPAPLDARQIRAFAVLARTGSFSRTARELHLTQSAISHTIKALEEEVRCRLLDRIGKRVTLTQAGEQLLVHVQKILQEMDTAREKLSQLGRWGHGRLRVGASLTACQYILPAVLREFKESFPNCVIHIEPGDTAAQVELLRQHRIDLSLTVEPRKDRQFEFEQLFSDELKFIVSPLHPWAKAGRVNRAEIVRQNYILYTRTSYMSEMVSAYFNKENLVLPTSIFLGNMDAIKELVKLGLGISILAPWIAQNELRAGTLMALPLGKRKLKRNWGLLSWRARRRSLPEETFAGLCKSVVEHLA